MPQYLPPTTSLHLVRSYDTSRDLLASNGKPPALAWQRPPPVNHDAWTSFNKTPSSVLSLRDSARRRHHKWQTFFNICSILREDMRDCSSRPRKALSSEAPGLLNTIVAAEGSSKLLQRLTRADASLEDVSSTEYFAPTRTRHGSRFTWSEADQTKYNQLRTEVQSSFELELGQKRDELLRLYIEDTNFSEAERPVSYMGLSRALGEEGLSHEREQQLTQNLAELGKAISLPLSSIASSLVARGVKQEIITKTRRSRRTAKVHPNSIPE